MSIPPAGTRRLRSMVKSRFRAPKGVYDVIEIDRAREWERLERVFIELTGAYGYPNFKFPLFENTELFVRSVGEATDIVRKEMYTFEDRGGRSLTLRPEGTAGVVRAFVEHGLGQGRLPWKAAYFGPMFRAENVQRGRYRQFYQFGVEAIGVDDVDLDVEVIELGARFFADLGIDDLTIEINTMGGAGERGEYIAGLRDHITSRVSDMGDDDRRRLKLNPLRVLDSKDPRMIEALVDAPRLVDHLSVESRVRFETVLERLDAAGIQCEVNPRLVRGLDYYTHTTFEYVSASLDAAQNALGGGGQYSGLVSSLGGAELPGVGFGLGVERTLLAIDALSLRGPSPGAVDVWVVKTGDVDTEASAIVGELRRLEIDGRSIRVDRSYGDKSVKAQFKDANRLGAAFAVVVGQRDLADDSVTIKDMNSGEQWPVPISGLAGELNNRILEALDIREVIDQ